MTTVHHVLGGTLHSPPNPRVVCHCLLLEDRNGLALIDAGIGLLDAGRLPQPLIDMAGFQFDEADAAARRVEALGFRREDVTHVVLTHGDPDHAGGLADFPHAQVHVSAEELIRIAEGHPRYVPAQFAHGPRWRSYPPSGRRWFGLEARPVALGFESEVLLIPLFGHTLGHCGVAVGQGGRWVLHAGDAYYLRVELATDDHPVSELALLRADDDALRRASLAHLRQLARDHAGEVELFGYHDPAEFPGIALSPDPKEIAVREVTIEDVRAAEAVVRPHVSAAPLIRSYALERELGLPPSRHVWLKDFGWTPSGSFKLLGGLNWMANNVERLGSRPVAAHSSGNFASGIAYAGMRFGRRVIVVMPQSAPRVKFERTRSFGAEVRTYDQARDHETGERVGLTRRIVEEEGAVLAHPYDDPHVIAGNGVGAVEVVRDLRREGRAASHFFCPVSGGGLLAGQALAIADGFAQAQIVGVEPAGADDFGQSLAAGSRVRLGRPQSICDGLLSYEVGEHNWPILRRLVSAAAVPDGATRAAMRWLYERHGLRTEPSSAIAVAALLDRRADLSGDGDLVAVISGRNADEDAFAAWIRD